MTLVCTYSVHKNIEWRTANNSMKVIVDNSTIHTSMKVIVDNSTIHNSMKVIVDNSTIHNSMKVIVSHSWILRCKALQSERNAVQGQQVPLPVP